MKTNKKTFNPLALLGFLGILAILWPITGQWPFILTLGYCTFFKYWHVNADELFRENLRSSAATGFFFTQVMFGITLIAWGILTEILQLVDAFLILYWGLVISIAVGLFLFSFKLSSLERKEKQDIRDH